MNDDIKKGMLAASAMLGVTDSEIRLAAGELSSDEMLAVKAVLAWRMRAIQRKANEIENES